MRNLVLAVALATTSAGATAAIPAAEIDRIDKIFADWRKGANAPGLVWGVVENGKLVAIRSQGTAELDKGTPAGPDSLFRIASMSKAFTALAILKLRDEGKLRLDDPAVQYIPQMKGWAYPTKDSPQITVRDLLHHNAGFVEDNPWGDRQQVLTPEEFSAMLAQGFDFSTAPQTRMEYSNTGYAMLGRIITNVSGQPYQDYIRTRIMAPLGMNSTGYDIFASPLPRRAMGYRYEDGKWKREPDMKDGEYGAMGGVQTSANDYWRWVAFLLSAWPPRDDADNGPVRRSTVREIVTGQNFASGRDRPSTISDTPCRITTAYGMGWNVIDDCQLGRIATHSGGYPGYGSNVALLPDKGIGLFAFANRTYGAPVPAVYTALLDLNEALELKPRAIPVSAGLAEAYDAAKMVWASGAIADAPLGNNMMMDHDADWWATTVTEAKAAVGECDTDAPITPSSAMEGTFIWTCTKGKTEGRVQRSPLKRVEIQALSFKPTPKS